MLSRDRKEIVEISVGSQKTKLTEGSARDVCRVEKYLL